MSAPPAAAAPPLNLADVLDDGVPRWDVIETDVLCSRCGYNLRMLTLPRCPECGLEFAWRDVLDAALWRSDFLFEHHWRTKPVRSLLLTTWRSLRPFSFWRRVSIHERVRAGPLWFLIFLSIVVFVLTVHGVAFVAYQIIDATLGIAGWSPGPAFGVRTFLREISHAPFRGKPGYLIVPAAALLAVLTALAMLCSLRETLSRSRVRTIQILRAFAYSVTPGVFWVAVGFLALACGVVWQQYVAPIDPEIGFYVPIALYLVLMSVFGFFLGAALSAYLRLPRAWLLGLTASLIGTLTAVAAVMLLGPLLLS